MEKKSQEVENSYKLLESLNYFEKLSLIEYVEDESQLVFFYSKNTDICSKMISVKEKIQNPFNEFLDWIYDEELEVEALIEAIRSILDIIEKKRKLTETKDDLEKDIAKLQVGKSTISTLFNFKSKKEDLISKENEKSKVRNSQKYFYFYSVKLK